MNALGLPARAAELAPGDASKALARFFYDTALVADPPALHALRACAPVGQILFGSDWPFAGRMYPPSGDPQPALAEIFDAAANEAILRNSAEREFGCVGSGE